MSLPRTTVPISARLAEALDTVRCAGLPALLVGRHGIGKSEFLLTYASQRGIEATVLDLSLLEAPDLTGLPYREGGLTRFAPPGTLPPQDASGPTMLVLEELNRCDRSVRQPCLQLLTSRHLNDYWLPDDCFVVACVNPEDGDYEVDPLDPALASRFATFRVAADPSAWVDWAESADVYAPVVSFIRRHPQAFDQEPPRSWTYAARILQEAAVRGLPWSRVEPLLVSVLNPMAVKGLMHELQVGGPNVPPPELLRNPLAFRARFESWAAQRRDDLLGTALDLLVRYLEHPETRFDTAEVDFAALEQVLRIAPPDLAATALARVGASLGRSRGAA